MTHQNPYAAQMVKTEAERIEGIPVDRAIPAKVLCHDGVLIKARSLVNSDQWVVTISTDDAVIRPGELLIQWTHTAWRSVNSELAWAEAKTKTPFMLRFGSDQYASAKEIVELLDNFRR